MNVHHKPPSASESRGVHPLDHIDAHFLCGTLKVFTPTTEQIAQLMARAREDLPVRLASDETVHRVACNNPDAFWAIARRTKTGGSPAEPQGLVAMLMLSTEGIDALLRGQLDTRNPPDELLVGQHERPAAIYGWLIHAKGRLAPGLTLVMEKLQTPLYRGVDIFCRASTKEGAAFFDALGFSRGVWWDEDFRAEFRHYRRSHHGAGASAIAHRLRPPFDDYMPETARPAQPSTKVKVVHTLDEIMKALAIRSAVYVEEQRCPYSEEFDGNDFSGSHLLASLDGEPAGCLRIRYFAGFAKIERVAVLGRFRQRGVGRKLVTAAVELCRAKGYHTVYAHARKSLLPFWSRLGFLIAETGRSFVFSDFEYVEIIRKLPPSESALAMAAGPYVLIRPEGQWDRPGILETSSQRGVAA